MTTVSFPIQVHMKEGAGQCIAQRCRQNCSKQGRNGIRRGWEEEAFHNYSWVSSSSLFFHGLRDTTSRFPHTKCDLLLMAVVVPLEKNKKICIKAIKGIARLLQIFSSSSSSKSNISVRTKNLVVFASEKKNF